MNKLIYLLMSLALAAQCSCQSNGEIYLQKDSTSCLSCPGLEDKTEGVMWSSQNARGTIWLCRNSLEIFNQSNGDPLFIDYKCKTDQLCLYQIKKHYPSEYQCYHGDSIENVKANFIADLKYLMLNFDGEMLNYNEDLSPSVKEGTKLTIKCEIFETYPTSEVKLYIQYQNDTKMHELPKKDMLELQSQVTKLVYIYEIAKVTRKHQSAVITCSATMRGITNEIASKLGIQASSSQKRRLEVQFKPVCPKSPRQYNTGINQSVVISCEAEEANPRVTNYAFEGPVDIIEAKPVPNTGKFELKPRSKKEFGKYECYPRNSVGTVRCEVTLVLGGYPDPPYNCKIDYNPDSNRTKAHINCNLGFNQGGSRLEFTVYEKQSDGSLKYLGTQNVYEATQKEVDFLAKVEEFKFYEFALMQVNNFGNSSFVYLSIGEVPQKERSLAFADVKNYVYIAGGVAGVLLLCLCCCCCTDCCSKECKCLPCNSSDPGYQQEKNMSSHRRFDEFHSPYDYEQKIDTKYDNDLNGVTYASILPKNDEKANLIREQDQDARTEETDSSRGNEELQLRETDKFLNTISTKRSIAGNIYDGFQTELSTKLALRRVENVTQLPKDDENDQKNGPAASSSYESTSTSSYNSHYEFVNGNNPTVSARRAPPTLPKPRNRAIYKELVNSLSTTPNGLLELSAKSVTPSTSVTDLSSITCTPQHLKGSPSEEKYAPVAAARTSTLQRNTVARASNNSSILPMKIVSVALNAATQDSRSLYMTIKRNHNNSTEC